MTFLDYLWLILFAAGLIFGAVRGFLKIVFALVGVIVVAVATSYLSPYADKWLSSLITTDGTRALVSMIATFLVLSVLYGLITKLISKLVNKITVLGWINRLLGAFCGAATVYVVFSLIASLVFGTSDGLFNKLAELLKQPFEESWIITNIYGGAENPEKNFFGHWLLENFLKLVQQYVPE